LEVIDEEVGEELDIVTVLKRLRVHGNCIRYLMDPVALEKITQKDRKRDIRLVKSGIAYDGES
jgi:hypothetical protein